MKSYSIVGIATSVIFACAVWALAAAAEDKPASVADVGRDFFVRYCAACHGPDGKGRGDFADLLKQPPADLTKISARNGGSFPTLKIVDIISGATAFTAHGTKDMPIWGERFAEDAPVGAGMSREREARGRILVLVEYLRSIQTK